MSSSSCLHHRITACFCGKQFCIQCSTEDFVVTKYTIVEDHCVMCPNCREKTVPEFHYYFRDGLMVCEGNLRTRSNK